MMENRKRILPGYQITREEKWKYREQIYALSQTAPLLSKSEQSSRAEYFAMKAEEQRGLATRLLLDTAKSYAVAMYEHKFLVRVAKMYAKLAAEPKGVKND